MTETAPSYIDLLRFTDKEALGFGEMSLTTIYDEKEGPYTWDFESGGLQFLARPHRKRLVYSIGGEWRVIPPNTPRAEIHFPGSKYNSLTIWNAISGLKLFLEHLDELKEKDSKEIYPQYLYGKTNRKTAMFAQKVGFKIADNRNNQTDNNETYLVIGETEEVRKTLHNVLSEPVNEKSLMFKLLKRYIAEQLRHPIIEVRE